MSKLTGVYLQNFQSIKEPVFFALDKLCLLYGPNSAGKSSILDAIDLIKKTVSIDTDKYNLNYYYRKNSPEDADCTVGIEYESKGFALIEKKSVNEWWESNDDIGLFSHQHFFDEIKHKKVQIEFGMQGNEVRVAIDGEPLFELNQTFTPYDDFYQRKRDQDYIDGEEELTIPCSLTLYKKNKLNNWSVWLTNFSSSWSDPKDSGNPSFAKSALYDLFVEENNETLTLNGIRFDAGCQFQTNFVEVHHEVVTVIFPDYDGLKKYRSNDPLYQEFVDQYFGHSEDKGFDWIASRRTLHDRFIDIAKDLNKLIQGFFYQIDALKFSHVSGNRQLINSDDCVSYPRMESLILKNCVINENQPTSMYARYLNAPEVYQYPESSLQGDFPNKAMRDYLISLRGYEVHPLAYEMTIPSKHFRGETAIEKLLYLKLKTKSKAVLGFEDVGSGISYVFPILTSLWASEFSFVEQPELHLHPSAQCELGDVFIAACNQGSSAVIESHSEHLLLRVLRRIRETTNDYLMPKELKFSHDNLRIYYFKPEPSGYTSVKEIKVDKYGEFLNSWPDGFFSERDRELFDE
jgi:predicted ATPase